MRSDTLFFVRARRRATGVCGSSRRSRARAVAEKEEEEEGDRSRSCGEQAVQDSSKRGAENALGKNDDDEEQQQV